MYQTLKTVFDHISKHLEVRQKYSAARRVFNSLLGVLKCGETRSFVFDILLNAIGKPKGNFCSDLVAIQASRFNFGIFGQT